MTECLAFPAKGGRRLGAWHIKFPEGTTGFLLTMLWTPSLSLPTSCKETIPTDFPTGLWLNPEHIMWQTHTFLHSVDGSLSTLLRVLVRLSSSRHGKQKADQTLQEREKPQMNCSITFRKTKERQLAAMMVHCRIKRRHKNLRILKREGARSRCILASSENALESIAGWWKIFLPWRQLVKLGGSDFYFKCKKSNAKLQESWKLKET